LQEPRRRIATAAKVIGYNAFTTLPLD